MLFYLDNWLSADPEREARRHGAAAAGAVVRARGRPADDAASADGRPQGPGSKRGLNENYAREIMELHTLGVDGGYTQKDVTEVARCFTGWTIRGLRDEPPGVRVRRAPPRPRRQGRAGPAASGPGGKDEGDEVIHLLATQPATAHFVSLKLARRFVADEPPAAPRGPRGRDLPQDGRRHPRGRDAPS